VALWVWFIEDHKDFAQILGLDGFGCRTTDGAGRSSVVVRCDMAIGPNSTKTGARPSHEAIEKQADATTMNKTERQKIDKMAMEMAKRGENEIIGDEEVNPEDTEFTK
jgi:hypothetical protein